MIAAAAWASEGAVSTVCGVTPQLTSEAVDSASLESSSLALLDMGVYGRSSSWRAGNG